MFGSMAFAAVMLYYKPDNGYELYDRNSSLNNSPHIYSVESWALREAKERMEARGEKYKYEPEPSSSSSSS